MLTGLTGVLSVPRIEERGPVPDGVGYDGECGRDELPGPVATGATAVLPVPTRELLGPVPEGMG